MKADFVSSAAVKYLFVSLGPVGSKNVFLFDTADATMCKVCFMRVFEPGAVTTGKMMFVHEFGKLAVVVGVTQFVNSVTDFTPPVDLILVVIMMLNFIATQVVAV